MSSMMLTIDAYRRLSQSRASMVAYVGVLRGSLLLFLAPVSSMAFRLFLVHPLKAWPILNGQR
jgi:hypothetical protein